MMTNLQLKQPPTRENVAVSTFCTFISIYPCGTRALKTNQTKVRNVLTDPPANNRYPLLEILR